MIVSNKFPKLPPVSIIYVAAPAAGFLGDAAAQPQPDTDARPHREVSVIVDSTAKYMIEYGWIDGVTVSLSKDLRDGRDWRDSAVIDREMVFDEEADVRFTHPAPRDGTHPYAYSYSVQWLLHGGQVYPTDPQAQRADDAVLVLRSPPVESRSLVVAGNPGILSDAGVDRVVFEMVYPLLGDEEHTALMFDVSDRSEVEQDIMTEKEPKPVRYRFRYLMEDGTTRSTAMQETLNMSLIFWAPDPSGLDAEAATDSNRARPRADGETEEGEQDE